MRIIAGKYKSRRIPDDRLKHTRPTTDFARSGLFNMIAHRMPIEGIQALDLFAGSGCIGFELLSRGAAHVVMIDNDRQSIQYLKKTAALLQAENLSIQRADVMRFLKSCRTLYPLVVADPPFNSSKEFYLMLIDLVLSHALSKGGYFILEHSASVSFADHPRFAESRRFGNIAFSFFS
jgi:16S rRNA (guanine(966)-N(2))-methyltransferase RsmD